jgi:hypothetical protein
MSTVGQQTSLLASPQHDVLTAALKNLLRATTNNQVEEVIRNLEPLGSEWRLVGDRNNYPTINVASIPSAAIVERVTNSIDARLELAAEAEPKLAEECTSPRIFVDKTFGVKDGYLSTLESKEKREELVEQAGIIVTLRDGDLTSTPTIDIQEAGIGISRTEFPETILSLNKDNKIKKWYLMGRFGQGGSATFRFSKYTVIVSRRQHPSRMGEEVSFTIVRMREAEKGEKDGQYVYLVSKNDNLPFSVSADPSAFAAGTLVRHVNYEIGKGNRPLLLDIYNLLQFRLFDPILPFWVVDERNWVANAERRRMFGSRDRLQKSELVQRSDELVAPVGNNGEYGSVNVRYWVFNIGTDHKQKLTFVDPDEPIVVSYLGQTHAALPKRILARDCQLPNLYRDLVVQIECDSLNDIGRRKIFTSGREVITEEGLALFRAILAEILPEELSDLDQEREISLLTQGVTRAKEALRRKLAEMINRIRPGTFDLTGGKGKGKSVTRKKTKHRKQYPPLPTKDFPTFIRIGNTNIPIRFSSDRTTWIGLESDAPDGFLSKYATSIRLSRDAPKFCRITSRHRDFKGGRLSLGVTLSGDHPANTQFKFGLELPVPHEGKTVTFDDWKQAIVASPKQGGGEKKVPLDIPDIREVDSKSSFWKSDGWTEDNVAEVREKEGHMTIYISRENKWLIGAVTNSAYAIATKERLMMKYILHMAFYAYLQHEGIENIESMVNGSGGSSSSSAASTSGDAYEAIKQKSLEWGARSILTAITSEQAFEKDVAQEDADSS